MADRSRAKPAPRAYRRNLPHYQRAGARLYVTFVTHLRAELPAEARDIVLDHIVFEHGRRLQLHAAVVMPDHVHLLFGALTDDSGATYGLAEILSGIKGASAHRVNQLLGRRGRCWQDESFDHVLRSDEQTRAVGEYICANPVRAGLVEDLDSYRWLWREWVEGAS
jgi:REP element-mobilizing transposase RayT